MFLCAGGCRNCPERFCKAVKIVREQGVALSDMCCEHPESEWCGTNLYERLDMMLDLLLAADDACHAGNLNLLKDIWREFKQIVPPSLIFFFCETYHDLDQWMENECRPYFNSVVVLGTEDSIDLDIQLIEVTASGLPKVNPDLEGATDSLHPVVPGERVFVVAPGSSTLAETWIGSAELGGERGVCSRHARNQRAWLFRGGADPGVLRLHRRRERCHRVGRFGPGRGPEHRAGR